jgi:integrase
MAIPYRWCTRAIALDKTDAVRVLTRIASLIEAHESRKTPDTGRFRGVVIAYKASGDYKKLADSTRRNWGRWLDVISDYFGDLRIAQFDRPERIRPEIRRWRNRFADKPRTADYAMQVLSRVLSYAVDPLGKIAGNPCEGIKQLYSADRSEIIWTDTDIAELKKSILDRHPPRAGAVEVCHAVDLAAHTGLRLGDLLKVSWSHVVKVGENRSAIILRAGKSRGRREVIIPVYDALERVLDGIPKRSTAILTNSQRRPWTVNSFGTAFNRAKIDSGMGKRDLHFRDLRGTAATRFYIAGLPMREIAEIMGWEEEYVHRIIRRYVGRNAAIVATIYRPAEQSRHRDEERTKIAKLTAKPGAKNQLSAGAGEGNRTLVCSLGSCRSTIELRPPIASAYTKPAHGPTPISATPHQSSNFPEMEPN